MVSLKELVLVTSILAFSKNVLAVKFDESLIRPWSPALEKEEPSKDPYIATFEKDKYKLIYLAAHHENLISSPTLKLVRQVVELKKFKVLLIEPIPFVKGESPESYIEYSGKGKKDDFVEGGESAYAVLLTRQQKTPFFGGEINDSQLLKEMMARGFTELDIVGFYLSRQIPQWKRAKKLEAVSLAGRAQPYIANSCKRLGVMKCPDFESVQKWYKERMGIEIHPDINGDSVAPYKNSKVWTQHISGVIGEVRDKYTLSIISELLGKYNEVFVVYGGSHYLTLKNALESGMGPAKLEFYSK